MENSEKSRREHPSTYVVQDRSNAEEINRLRIQDQMITIAMGGVLPEQSNPERFQRVLDVGCGTGGWMIEAALAYPNMSLFGIDVSGKMLDYAREQAALHGLSERLEFHVMDALRMLEFPTNYFDLVNLRFGVGWIRKWEWPKMLSELQRVAKPDGLVRVTDGEVIHRSSSPALNQWLEMLQCALYNAGNFFELTSDGLTGQLLPLFKQHGIRDPQTKSYAIEYRAGTPEVQAYTENWLHAFRTFRPFIQKWGCLSPQYDEVCKQAAAEMQRSDFHSTFPILTVWGQPAPQ